MHLDKKPKSWESHLTLFVGFLVSENKQSSTVRSYISAIKAVLRDLKIKLNEDMLLLNSIIRACKLNNDTICMRLPIRKLLLTVMINSVEILFESPQPYLTTLYKAMLVTA